MNGKGDSPRNCFSKSFKSNYDSIDWGRSNNKRDKINKNTSKKNKKENENIDNS